MERSGGQSFPHILVVEDDRGVRESLDVVLSVQGYEVTGVSNGEDALRIFNGDGGVSEQERPIDLIVLDLNLPGIDGVETCRMLRSRGHSGPVLMLTARHEVSDRVKGLDAGADDYLPKPFALDELLARIRSLLRGFAVEVVDDSDTRAIVDDLILDLATRRAWRGEREIEMTKIEFDLLTFMIENAERVLTRSEIMMEIWGYEEDVSSNTLEVFVSNLRKKLELNGESRLLHTKRGVGYVVRADR